MLRIALIGLFLITQNAFSQSGLFRYNLVGYAAKDIKQALYLSREPCKEPIYLKMSGSNKTVMRIMPHEKPLPWDPFPYYYSLDFTACERPGQYFLTTADGATRSGLFSIGPYPAYQEEVLHFMRSQRCGYNPFLDVYCHQKDGRTFFGPLPDSTQMDARGGWHDAGDQLKYLITSSNATARMLLAYEWAPTKFGDKVDAMGKEGGNQIADILDEARWGLDWIHQLHPASGQLYHQVADDRDHRGFKLPHEDNADYGWGENGARPVYFATGKPQGAGKYLSEATGIANLAGRSAAAMALGFRHFKAIDQAYAQKCLTAAIDLYEMGQKQEGYQQGNSYGAPYRYTEDTWADDMEWAAAELYKATKKKEYLKDGLHYAQLANTTSWMEMDSAAHYQMYPFINIGHFVLSQIVTQRDKQELAGYYRHNLEKIKVKAATNPYGVSHLFIWCSNNLAVAVATQAYLYEQMTGDQQFRSLLAAHRDWLLGNNPWGTSMFTGLPADGDYPLDVHMPFWRLQKKMIAGSLVDGPIWQTIHGGMIGIKPDEPDEYEALQPPHIKYMDDWADYSTNEPTMDGSADAIFLLALFSQEVP
ncbi:glycoside hydrolase family 9 protein [Dyadobacter tibetensis]|uniref:glycoside hydrolase family 9 protein n=1 Tax=Dyadobacter tibetensis TaxID=1211851 RepID=UPI0004701643|nr:glycoside hydrolase family 9 protein [Dyadobacter tibetensis]